MSRALAIVGIIMLGTLALAVINLTQHVQSGNELDYYLLEETTEAAMLDAVDMAYYRYSGGVVRMDRERFIESFLRRFAENINTSRDYDIKIIDLNEIPPKVSVEINAGSAVTFNSEQAEITNKIDAIIETKYKERRKLEQVVADY